ncbi:hypothetical protein HPB50_016342 [Hyalomma asiaticum]|uniref:Uncharacterized protein n=1 Tax=Hyalomma asiaticum TaxID=266040 RepID=A0ACB7SG29_HYAAI|nr:hypothetical protein HPB50_016342 [Hyalomma asiaticum]
MGDCPKPKSEMAFADSSLMQRYATRNDANMVEGSTSHFPQDPVTSERSNSSSLSCGDRISTEVADKESERDSGQSTRDMGAKNDFRWDDTELMQGLFRCAVTDESPVLSCEQGTIPPGKHVLPTCLSQQDVWASEASTQMLLRGASCMERHPIQCQVQEYVGRINGRKQV